MAAQSIVNLSGAFHVASRSDTNLDDVLADRLHPELRIKRSHPDNLFRSNFRFCANVFHRFLRKVIERILDRLQNWDDRLGLPSFFSDYLIDSLLYVRFVVHVIFLH